MSSSTTPLYLEPVPDRHLLPEQRKKIVSTWHDAIQQAGLEEILKGNLPPSEQYGTEPTPLDTAPTIEPLSPNTASSRNVPQPSQKEINDAAAKRAMLVAENTRRATLRATKLAEYKAQLGVAILRALETNASALATEYRKGHVLRAESANLPATYDGVAMLAAFKQEKNHNDTERQAEVGEFAQCSDCDEAHGGNFDRCYECDHESCLPSEGGSAPTSSSFPAPTDSPPYECEHKFRLVHGYHVGCGGAIYECMQRRCGAWYCKSCDVHNGIIHPHYDSTARVEPTLPNDTMLTTLVARAPAGELLNPMHYGLYDTGFDDNWCAFPVTTAEDNPSYNEAMRSHDKPMWDDAMEKEIENLLQFGAFTLVPEDSIDDWDPAQRRAPSVTPTLWVLRRKRDSKGEISKYKARCVYNDKRRVNRTLIETFSPAVRHTTVKASVACSVLRGRRRLSFDVTGAYLQGEYSDDEMVYARPPKGYETFDDRGIALVWRMHVPLYGQGDAGLIWFRTIREQLTLTGL